MILVDKQAAGFAASYDRVERAERVLRRQRRHQSLVAYERRRAAYDAARRKRHSRLPALVPWLVVAGVLTCVLLLAGLLAQIWALIAAGVVVGAGAGAALAWSAGLAGPRKPPHPLHGRLKEQAGRDLVAEWRSGLDTRLPPMEYDGAMGEYDLIAGFRALRRSQGYIVYRLQQRPGDDVDIAVIAPSGVWVFEVKYWSGRIAWRNGRWDRTKTYYAARGRQVTEDEEVSQAPDQQWQRMAQDVVDTLRRREPTLFTRLPVLHHPRGGLAFTHPKATYDIDPACPVTCGSTAYWTRKLASTPAVPGLDEPAMLRVLDCLLTRHRDVSHAPVTSPLDGYAVQIIRKAQDDLQVPVGGVSAA